METFYKSPEQPIFAGKTVFLEFLELYFKFLVENAGNMLEIAISTDFLLTFSTYFVVLFHTKTLLISLFRLFVRSFARSFVRSFAHSFALSLSGRSNQQAAC